VGFIVPGRDPNERQKITFIFLISVGIDTNLSATVSSTVGNSAINYSPAQSKLDA